LLYFTTNTTLDNIDEEIEGILSQQVAALHVVDTLFTGYVGSI
jgi:pyridoxal/pyridoxine/pyridoxamine kinase